MKVPAEERQEDLRILLSQLDDLADGGVITASAPSGHGPSLALSVGVLRDMLTPHGWEWYGYAGHFVGAKDCRFHLHTHVDGYCVSTVGAWMPRGADEPETIGHERLYETMVFELEDGDHDGKPLDVRAYNDREAARAGHIEMCRKVESGEVGNADQ